jgi:hypothetical protein
VSTAVGLIGVAQQDICDGRVTMAERKVEASYRVDNRRGKVNALILPQDGSAEDGGSDLSSMCIGVLSGFARLVCVSNSLLGVLVRPLVFR